MTTVDLSRIPEVHRERVQRLVTAARDAKLCATNVNDPHAAVAPFLKIADKADDAAARQYTTTCAGGGYTPGDQIPETMRLVCEGSANAARAKVWADELAKLDARADPVADMRAEAAAARDPMAARMMSMTAAAWEKAAERSAPAKDGPLCEWGLCREPLSAPPRDGCGARNLHATPAPRAFLVRFTGENDAARLYGVLLGMQINFPRAIGALGDRLEPILEALRGPAAPEVEEAPADIAADAVERAIRAAQRAHLDATRPAFTGTVQTEARLDIHDATDARMVLDALMRFVGIGGTGRRVLPEGMVSDLGDMLRGQLADKPRETVAAINALLRTLPHSSYLTVGLGTSTPEAHALLVSLGGRDRVVDYYGSAMHHCCVELDGIEWRASHTPAPGLPSIAGAAGLDMAASAGGDR